MYILVYEVTDRNPHLEAKVFPSKAEAERYINKHDYLIGSTGILYEAKPAILEEFTVQVIRNARKWRIADAPNEDAPAG
jgi:hypothetical protein